MSRLVVVDSEERRQRAVLIATKLPLKPIHQIVFEEYHPTRSRQQNRRYWLVINMIAKHVGHDKDEIHDMMKARFLGTRIIEIAGERAQVAPSSRKLKVKEFKVYMDNVESWAIEKLGLWLDG